MYRCESHTHTVGHGYFRLGCRLSAMDISLSRAPFRSKSKTAHTWARSDICDSVMTCGPVENHTAHRRASRSYPHVRVITVAQAHLLGAYTLIMLLTTTHADPHGSRTRASYILTRVCHRSPPHTTRGGPRTSYHLCLSMGCWGVRRHELCTPHTRISVHGTTTFRVLTRAAYIRVGCRHVVEPPTLWRAPQTRYPVRPVIYTFVMRSPASSTPPARVYIYRAIAHSSTPGRAAPPYTSYTGGVPPATTRNASHMECPTCIEARAHGPCEYTLTAALTTRHTITYTRVVALPTLWRSLRARYHIHLGMDTGVMRSHASSIPHARAFVYRVSMCAPAPGCAASAYTSHMGGGSHAATRNLPHMWRPTCVVRRSHVEHGSAPILAPPTRTSSHMIEIRGPTRIAHVACLAGCCQRVITRDTVQRDSYHRPHGSDTPITDVERAPTRNAEELAAFAGFACMSAQGTLRHELQYQHLPRTTACPYSHRLLPPPGPPAQGGRVV